MRQALVLLWLSVLVATLGCATSRSERTCPGAGALESAFPSGESQLVARAGALTWKPCPPTLPSSCKMALLEGDPSQEMLFTVRFAIGEALELKPHWHPRNERVTILEGRVGVGFGDEIALENAQWFGPGDYYVNAKGAHHFVLTEGPAVLQITGIGPWKVYFLEEN